MSVASVPLRLNMKGNTQVENVTTSVQRALAGTGLKAGLVTVFIKHTTASVMIIEDEPGLRADTKAVWDRLVPPDPAWQHNTRNAGEDNAQPSAWSAPGAIGDDPLQRRRACARHLAADCRRGFRYEGAQPRSRCAGDRRVDSDPVTQKSRWPNGFIGG